MKYMAYTILLLSPVLIAGSTKPDPIDTLINALCAVESNHNPRAIGDGGQAVGILQIHPIMIKDVNRILRKDAYTLSDRKDPGKSRMICRVYLLHYGKGKSNEYLARIWNGGPSGHKKQATAKYWNKVKNILKGKDRCKN